MSWNRGTPGARRAISAASSMAFRGTFASGSPSSSRSGGPSVWTRRRAPLRLGRHGLGEDQGHHARSTALAVGPSQSSHRAGTPGASSSAGIRGCRAPHARPPRRRSPPPRRRRPRGRPATRPRRGRRGRGQLQVAPGPAHGVDRGSSGARASSAGRSSISRAPPARSPPTPGEASPRWRTSRGPPRGLDARLRYPSRPASAPPRRRRSRCRRLHPSRAGRHRPRGSLQRAFAADLLEAQLHLHVEPELDEARRAGAGGPTRGPARAAPVSPGPQHVHPCTCATATVTGPPRWPPPPPGGWSRRSALEVERLLQDHVQRVIRPTPTRPGPRARRAPPWTPACSASPRRPATSRAAEAAARAWPTRPSRGGPAPPTRPRPGTSPTSSPTSPAASIS